MPKRDSPKVLLHGKTISIVNSYSIDNIALNEWLCSHYKCDGCFVDRPFAPMHAYLSKVNLLQGTRSVHDFSTGNTLPLVARPWGLNHWTLQTGKSPWTFNSSLHRLWGVRLTHQPSPWMRDYASLLITPFTGNCTESIEHQNSAYCLQNSVLRPDYLETTLLRYGITIRMSPTERGAVFHFIKKTNDPLRLRFEFDQNHSLHAEPGSRVFHGVTRDSFEGECLQNFGLHFMAETTAPITHFQPTPQGAFLEFPAEAHTLELRIATSFINRKMAQTCLQRELRGRSLPEIQREGAGLWEKLLGRIDIKGTSPSQEQTFYSCLYRCLLFPRYLDEMDEQGRTLHYSPYDGQVHEGPLCADSGFWDGYRTLYPLLTLVYPDVLTRMFEGFLNISRQADWAPKWPSPGSRNCMIGTHFDAVVADAVVKGITRWNIEEIYPYLWKNATVPSSNGNYGRQGLEEYLNLGYVAADKTSHAAACTLDYAYDDFCIAQVARHLGRKKEADTLLRRSQNYRNIFDSSIGFMRGRLLNGEWQTPFREFAWGGPYIEGGPWQHTFNVPHDVPGLAALFGGGSALCRKLDTMLATPPRFETGTYPYEIHEMTEMALAPFGQYAHSNQPVHNYLFLFALAGEPKKTAYWTKKVLRELYGSNHFPGDEDNGEMSAWYVWTSLGLYPCCPGRAEYLQFQPSVLSASIQIPDHSDPLLLFQGGNVTSGLIAHHDLIHSSDRPSPASDTNKVLV